MAGTDITPPKDGFHPAQAKIAQAKLTAAAESEKNQLAFKQALFDRLLSAHFFVFLIVLVLVGTVLAFAIQEKDFAKVGQYLDKILPVITTYIGFAIGQSVKDKE